MKPFVLVSDKRRRAIIKNIQRKEQLDSIETGTAMSSYEDAVVGMICRQGR